jgi:hypothetical protein
MFPTKVSVRRKGFEMIKRSERPNVYAMGAFRNLLIVHSSLYLSICIHTDTSMRILQPLCYRSASDRK